MGHLWAERYDGSIDDVFELQDEVCEKVVAALSIKLTSSEVDNLKTVHTSNLDAYELFVRARATPFLPVPERIESAREMFERVIDLDPEFAGGYAGVSSMLSFGAMWAHGDTTDLVARAREMACQTISVDPSFGWSHTAMGMAELHLHRYAEAITSAREAINRQPNDADAHAFLGLIVGLDGQHAASIAAIDQGIRMNPLFFNGPYLNMRGQTQLLGELYDAAVESFRENTARGGPIGPPALCWGAAAYAGHGDIDEARRLTARLGEAFPKFTMTGWNYLSLIREDHVRERVLGLMRDARVAET